MTAPRFVEFTRTDGQPYGVQVAHVIDFVPAIQEGRPCVLLTMIDDSTAWVRESFPDVLKALRGEKADA